MKKLLENMMDLIYPKCQLCNCCATRVANRTFLLGGEEYFCDEHSHKDLTNQRGSQERTYKDLNNAVVIRQANAYILDLSNREKN